MSHKTTTYYSIIRLSVKKAFQKIHFQIKHPQDAKFLTGIHQTAFYGTAKRLGRIGTELGIIKLAIAESGDVAYTDVVKRDTPIYQDLGDRFLRPYTSSQNLNSNFSVYGKRQTFYETYLNITEAIAEGYYEDTYNPSPNPFIQEINTAFFVPYEVLIYLRYELLTYSL